MMSNTIIDAPGARGVRLERLMFVVLLMSFGFTGCEGIQVPAGEASCSPDSTRCSPVRANTVEVCQASGESFIFLQECTSGQICDGGACVAEALDDGSIGQSGTIDQSGDGGCGALSEQGCCAGNKLRYCNNGAPTVEPCSDSCGWDPGLVIYNCGFQGADPTGNHPRVCP